MSGWWHVEHDVAVTVTHLWCRGLRYLSGSGRIAFISMCLSCFGRVLHSVRMLRWCLLLGMLFSYFYCLCEYEG